MNNQKYHRKGKSMSMDRLNRGDMIRKQKHRSRSPEPRDQGDVKRNKKLSKPDTFKTKRSKSNKPKKAKSLKISTELVSRSVNTLVESVPVCFDNPFKFDVDLGPDGSVDYRKRVKARYTFRRFQTEDAERPGPRKDEDVRKVNNTLQNDARHALNQCYSYLTELPKQTHIVSSDTNRPPEEKHTEKVKDRESVDRATSVIKLKSIIKTTKDDSVGKKSHCTVGEKNSSKNSRHRKVVIKTITSKVDAARVYKAVTFVEHKQRKPLQIKIPKHVTFKSKSPISRIPKLISAPMPKPERGQVKRRNEPKKRPLKRVDNIKSASSKKSVDSVPTEVAKWAPESINQHTMPYYEAWVNKTLTAISKCSKEEKAYLEKSKVLKALQEFKMRNRSPDLMYEKFADEKYAGRIRVRQRPPKI